jgi:flagellar biosynthesis protein FliQ
VLYAGLMWAMRRVMAPLLLRQMGAVSKAGPARNALAGANGRKAKSELGFERLDAQPVSPEALRMRKAVVASARRLFRLATAMDVGVGLAYFNAATTLGDPDRTFVAPVAATVLVIALLRYLMYRRQYFGRRGWVPGHVGGLL